MTENERIGEIIFHHAFLPDDTATAFDFVRRKRGNNSPFLEMAKEICKESRHNNAARALIRAYCKDRESEIDNIDLFRAHYVESKSLSEIADIVGESITGDTADIRRGISRKIDGVQYDFAVWLSLPVAFVFQRDDIAPGVLPCGGNKSVMRGNCKRCFYNDYCID